MSGHDQYLPSPSERVRDQVARYESTDGREGGTLEGRPVVILTMTGAVTGKVRKTPVMRIERDGVYVAVASAAGAPRHPAWYHNLIANPEVRLRDGAQVHRLRAREVFGQEKAEIWQLAESRWPHFPEYRANAGREIPILLLEPVPPVVATPERNKQLVQEAFDTLFNRRDYTRAQTYWSPDYIQHSAHIPPGRDGLFNLIKSLPETLRHETEFVVAEGDMVMLRGRFSGHGQPAPWIVVDTVRVRDGRLVEHWDVVEDEVPRADSVSGLPMFGDNFPDDA